MTVSRKLASLLIKFGLGVLRPEVKTLAAPV